MKVNLRWREVYSALVCDDADLEKNATAAARQIERDIADEGWPAGEIFSNFTRLMQRYSAGRDTIRQAVRLLEDRKVARMRRGPNGGLVVLRVPYGAVVNTVCDYLLAVAPTAAQLRQAHAALDLIGAFTKSGSVRPTPVSFQSVWREPSGPHSEWMPMTSPIFAGCRLSDDRVACLFSECLAAYETLLSAIDFGVDGDGQEPANPYAGNGHPLANYEPGDLERGAGKLSRASVAIRMIASDLRCRMPSASVRLGTEDELCVRYGVSKQVVRQAIRVLENYGVIESQRGRGHGVIATDRAPTAVIETIVAYFSSVCPSDDNVSACQYMLSKITSAKLTIMPSLSGGTYQRVMQAVNRICDWDKAESLTQLSHLTWKLIDNPILHLMDQALQTYRARQSHDDWFFASDRGLSVQQKLRGQLQAVFEGDLPRADRLHDEACAEMYALFHPA
jgi:DNA-binding GntR family transcriptional regulator